MLSLTPTPEGVGFRSLRVMIGCHGDSIGERTAWGATVREQRVIIGANSRKTSVVTDWKRN